jgi:hypothetical protein
MERDEAIRQLRDHLMRAQERMKHFADKKRNERSFEIGEWVFVKLRAHRQKSVVSRIHAKLAAKYYGPYPVVERIGAVAYRLKLPDGSRVHPVFHVSLLKKAIGRYNEEAELPDHLEGDKGIYYEPEDILAKRTIVVQGEEVCQLLVQWKGQKAEEATREDAVSLKSQFPTFNLEDKVVLSGGSIVRNDDLYESENVDLGGPAESLVNHSTMGPRVWKVYSRRGRKVTTA